MNSPAEQFVWAEYRRVLEPHVPQGLRLLAETAVSAVLIEYERRHRVYHFVDHLANVLRELRKWESRLSEYEYLVAFVALLLHDVEYHIPSLEHSNEELSAGWVRWFIVKCGLVLTLNQEEIESAIRITEGHQPTDLVSLAVCWCDLATFADPQKSKEASEKIAQEYLQVYTPEEYEEGRRKFLTSYRSPFKTYPGAPLSLRLRARRLNRKANRQLDRELAELDGAE